jgi:signal transduction histidine kinase
MYMNLDILRKIHTNLERHHDLSALFEAIMGLTTSLGAEVALLLLQEDNGLLHFRSTHLDARDVTGLSERRYARQLITTGLIGQVLRRGKAEIVDDFAADPRSNYPDNLLDNCHGAILLPLQLLKAQARGVILLGSNQVGHFSRTDLPYFEMVTILISQHLENALLFRAQAEHSTQLSLINEVSRAATSILNVGVMLATVTQAIQRSFGFDRVSIYRLKPSNNLLQLEAYTGSDGRTYRPETSIPVRTGVIAQAIEYRQTIVINDVNLDQRYTPQPDEDNIRAILVIPIKLGVKTIGIIDLQSRQSDAFLSHLVSALETMTDQLAVAIENARLYDEVCDKVNELLSLNHISQAVTSSLDLTQTLTLVTEHVTNMLNVAATSVALREDKTGELIFAAASGEGAKEVLGLRIPLGKGVAGWVAETGEPLIVPNVRADSRFLPDVDKKSGFITHSILCVPMVAKGRLIGAIEAMNKLDGSEFTIQDLNLLADLTAPAATAIENAQLYQDLAQNMKRLEDTQAQLIQSAKLSAIGELAAGVAHEINNPLTSIIGLAAVVGDQFEPSSEEGEDLRIIRAEAERAKKIVQSLLDFARIGNPVQSPANLNQVLESAIFLALPDHVQHKIKLHKHLNDIPLVYVDENQMKQVFINILNNAVYAMPAGGQMTVTSRTLPDRQHAVCLSIADTGCGIAPEHIDKIFDPFFTTKEVGQGTGLGLSVSYGIIERHHGCIEVETEPGIGTAFHIILPVTEGFEAAR